MTSGSAGGIQLDLNLARVSKIYHEGESIAGSLQIHSGKEFQHDGIQVALQGNVTTQPIIGLGSSTGNNISLIDYLVQVVNPGKIPAGKTEIPFQLVLKSDHNNNNDDNFGGVKSDVVKLFETYHGVKINIDYIISAEIKRSGILASNVSTKCLEFYVERRSNVEQITPNKTGDEEEKEDLRYDFVMTPETLRQKKKKKAIKIKSGLTSSTTTDISSTPAASSRGKEVSDFSVCGFLSTTKCRLSDPLVGLIRVERSERQIKSLELQLIRVESVCADETTGPPTLREASEVQNIQIGDGDVTRNVDIPIYMIFPRQFVCPTIQTNVFAIAFELNINVIFEDNYVAAENVPLILYR